jgi:hypothetical protein
MEVVVKLKDDADATPADQALAAMGLSRTLVHPQTDDPGLRPYSTVEVPDEPTARQVAERLAGLQGVEAAYVQPPAELP